MSCYWDQGIGKVPVLTMRNELTGPPIRLVFLLSEWEEPEIVGKQAKKASVRDLVHFRKAVSYMYDNYPFSRAFGEVGRWITWSPSNISSLDDLVPIELSHSQVKTREMCVDSSQRVYDRLMLSAGDASALPFSILSILAMDDDGDYVEAKIKALIRLYRPDRLGNLTKLDFVKSIDTVYKQLRLLRASIANSGTSVRSLRFVLICPYPFSRSN